MLPLKAEVSSRLDALINRQDARFERQDTFDDNTSSVSVSSHTLWTTASYLSNFLVVVGECRDNIG